MQINGTQSHGFNYLIIIILKQLILQVIILNIIYSYIVLSIPIRYKSFLYRSFWAIDRTLTGTTIQG